MEQEKSSIQKMLQIEKSSIDITNVIGNF